MADTATTRTTTSPAEPEDPTRPGAAAGEGTRPDGAPEGAPQGSATDDTLTIGEVETGGGTGSRSPSPERSGQARGEPDQAAYEPEGAAREPDQATPGPDREPSPATRPDPPVGGGPAEGGAPVEAGAPVRATARAPRPPEAHREPAAPRLPTVAAQAADLAGLVSPAPAGAARPVPPPVPYGPAPMTGYASSPAVAPDHRPGSSGYPDTSPAYPGSPTAYPGPAGPETGPGDRSWQSPEPGYRTGVAAMGVPTLGAPASAVLGATPVSAPPRGVAAAPPGARGAVVGAARVTESIRPPRASAPRGPRRARLSVKRVDPWSVMKFSFAVSVVLFIVMIVAASVLYLALDTMGVFASINDTVVDLVGTAGEDGGSSYEITAQRVIGTAAALGALNILLFTSLATLGAFIYNVCADLVGGVEVTLAERD